MHGEISNSIFADLLLCSLEKHSPITDEASALMKANQNLLPLLLKTWALFTFLVLVVLAPAGILIARRATEIASAEMVQNGNLLARNLAASARIPLLSRDDLTLKLLVKSVDDNSEILYAFVTDTRNTILARAGSIEPLEVLRQSQSSKESGTSRDLNSPQKTVHMYPFVDLSAPVTYQGKTIGMFHLGLSRPAVEEYGKSTAAIFIGAFLRYSIPGFVLGLVVLFFCTRYTAARMEQLLSGINELIMHNPGFRITRAPRGLLGKVITAFNRLSQGLDDTSEKEQTAKMPPRLSREPASPSTGLLPTEITRNQVTVLFAGVKGFKEYAENRTPEDILVDLNEYFTLAARIAAGYDGQVDKFIGDAVSLVFPSTPLKPDHTKRAVEAAVALQEALADQKENGNEILGKIGIGISTGVALSGPVDALSSKVHTFIGENFKTAYSLNVLAGPGEIIISNDVFQAIEHLVMVEPIPPREVMAKTEAWENFRLKGLLPREGHEIPVP